MKCSIQIINKLAVFIISVIKKLMKGYGEAIRPLHTGLSYMYTNGFIKLHRKILDWEWYKDLPVCRLFIHLLLSVNYESKSWQGQVIHRGEMITSISHLSADTGLSEKQIRTALKKLSSTGEITVKSSNKYSKITINNYNNYQGFFDNDKDDDMGKQAVFKNPPTNAKKLFSSGARGQAKGMQNGIQRATTKEIKEIYTSSTAAELVSLGDFADAENLTDTADKEWLSLTEEERNIRLMF